MRSVYKKYTLTLLIRKAYAVARIVWTPFAITLYIWKTCTASERNMP